MDCLITRILLHYSIDLSSFHPVDITATYDSKTFASMGYVLVGNECCNDSVKLKSNHPKVSKIATNPVFVALKEVEEIKERMKFLEEGTTAL